LDSQSRDAEDIPLNEDVDEYLAREVLPHVPDALVSDRQGKIGYGIPFSRRFYRYTPPRPSEDIKADLRSLEAEIPRLLEEVLV
jgi:type I restriction enzyme M protein